MQCLRQNQIVLAQVQLRQSSQMGENIKKYVSRCLITPHNDPPLHFNSLEHRLRRGLAIAV